MDDVEEDARYPPNPYHRSHSRPLPSSNRSKLHPRNTSPHPFPISRSYPEDVGDEDDEDRKEVEDDDGDGDGDGDGDERKNVIEDEEDDVEESSESSRKRRRLDRYVKGFEFVPRQAPSPSSKQPPSRSSSADWSEDSTFALLDAWGDRYLQNGRKSLRSDEWVEVAMKVSQGSKTSRSEAQCRNRLGTLKKKYKKEKAKYPDYASSSIKWIYFKKIDELMSSPSPPLPAAQLLSCGIDAGEYVFASSRLYVNRSNGMDELRDSPGDSASEDQGEEVDDDSDGLPPRREKMAGSSESSFRMLADSIQKFGEIYEKIENNQRQQMGELERMRKEFHRDLELQKRGILERGQAEIAGLRQEAEEDEEERADDDGSGDDDIDVLSDNLSV